MCSRQFWNSHQRHKFLRATETRDMVKIRVSEMAFPGVFKRYFQEVLSPGISNPFCGGSMDIFWNYTIFFKLFWYKVLVH